MRLKPVGAPLARSGKNRLKSVAPIGLFDSGVGGLTLLSVLEASFPTQGFIYLGDAARLPYGAKSPQTVERYAIKAAQLLLERGIKALVVACNTASAVALPTLRREIAPLPVFGVVEPGAQAACARSATGRIAVLATEGTVRGGAYVRAILARCPEARILTRSASLLVTLAEDLEAQDEALSEAIVRHSLRGLIGGRAADTLLLGCTHFPALGRFFRRALPGGVSLVDSAAEVAREVARELFQDAAMHLPATGDQGNASGERNAGRVLLTTDNTRRFARLGSIFLGERILASEVELVELV